MDRHLTQIALVEAALQRSGGPQTRSRHAFRNLARLRHAVEHHTSLAYFSHPEHGRHAHRLAADSLQLGGATFAPTLATLGLLGTTIGDEDWDGCLLDLLLELEQELLELERTAGSLWTLLARHVT